MAEERNSENCVEFVNNERFVTCTFNENKWVNKILKLYEAHPEDFKYCVKNNDGSVCAKVSKKYFKLSPPRKVSEEQRQASAERFKKLREEGKL